VKRYAPRMKPAKIQKDVEWLLGKWPGARRGSLWDDWPMPTPPVWAGGGVMPKYLFEAIYTPEGVKGLTAAGAASRVAAVGDMCAGLGGSVDSFHFAFGKVDAYVICDLPDDEAAAAAAFTIGSSTAVQLRTIKLFTIEEADAAIGRAVAYRPPGS
jgi:uncharacterized protein with GYD domain